MNVVRVPVPSPVPLTRVDIAAAVESVAGRRVVLANERGIFRGFRAWSEPQTRKRGFGADAALYLFLPVVTERDWWAASLLGEEPDVVLWPAGAVWVEDLEAEPHEPT